MDWLHLFVVGGVWWWLLTLVFVAGSFGLVVCKRGAFFLVSLLLYLGLVQFLGDTPVLEFLGLHSLWVVGSAGGFVAGSIFWFNWRWHWFTSKARARYDDVLARWLHEKGLPGLPPEDDTADQADALRVEWQDYFEGHRVDEFGPIEFRPKFRNHKDAILTWMAAWPLDMLVWLFAEVLHDFWNMLYYKFQSCLQAIMERNWRGTEGHMLSPAERQAWEARKAQQATAGTPGPAASL